MNGVIVLVLVGLGCFLILLGAYMAFRDWNKKYRLTMTTEQHALDKNINALAKLARALKDYPPGQQLIFLGIVILLIAGAWGGLASLGK